MSTLLCPLWVSRGSVSRPSTSTTHLLPRPITHPRGASATEDSVYLPVHPAAAPICVQIEHKPPRNVGVADPASQPLLPAAVSSPDRRRGLLPRPSPSSPACNLRTAHDRPAGMLRTPEFALSCRRPPPPAATKSIPQTPSLPSPSTREFPPVPSTNHLLPTTLNSHIFLSPLRGVCSVAAASVCVPVRATPCRRALAVCCWALLAAPSGTVSIPPSRHSR